MECRESAQSLRSIFEAVAYNWPPTSGAWDKADAQALRIRSLTPRLYADCLPTGPDAEFGRYSDRAPD
jgi:hypothetical protein